MRGFRERPIRQQLVLITMLTSCVTLVVVCVAFVSYDLRTLKSSMQRDLLVLTDIIGRNTAAALLFDDQESAMETLAALRAEQRIVAGAVYDRSGAQFAAYVRQGEREGPPPTMPGEADGFRDGSLYVTRSIRMGEELVGLTWMQADLRELDRRLQRYAWIVGLVVCFSIAVALFLSARLQRVISQPILALAGVARDVSTNKDYSLRAGVQGGGEIRALTMDFNEMLALIQARDDALRQKTRQLAAANRELESFSYSVSHDLRVPVRAVNGLSRVLVEEHAGGLDPEGVRILGLMRESARGMQLLIEGLLEFSRLGRRRIETQRVDMTALARGVVEELLGLEPQQERAIAVADLPPAHGDPTMLHQVLVNLISNALKFTRHVETARIDIGVERVDGVEAYFVRDNGVGFDMKYAHKLFVVFQRLHTSKTAEGSGVGLAIVRRIIDRHDGRVWAEARPGEGATFYFTLGSERG
jgi:signal transduction histidine kinase